MTGGSWPELLIVFVMARVAIKPCRYLPMNILIIRIPSMNIINFRFSALAVVFISLIATGCGGSSKKQSTASSSIVPVASSSVAVVLPSSSATSIVSSSAIASSVASSSVNAVATFKKVNISAPSLSENLIGQLPKHDIWVYLPKAYTASSTPLPVIYYLPGFGDFTMLDVSIPNDMNTVYNSLSPAILVVIHGVNRYGGSFFADSFVTGNWSQFIVKDVVNYMDSNYRTIPHSRARGIAGHSMGGFGVVNLAMRHPEVFGSAFAVAPGLMGSNGLKELQIFDTDQHIKAFIAAMAPIKDLAPAAALSAMDAKMEFHFDIAYGMTFAPSSVPPYFEYPYTLVNNTLVRDEAIWAKWESGFGNVHNEVQEFKGNFAMLRNIGIDCGSSDYYQWIVRGCAYFDSELTAAGIPHVYTTHPGDHQTQLRSRVLTQMLPFFSQHLARE